VGKMLRRAQLAAVGASGIGMGWALAQLDRSSRDAILPSGSNTCCDAAPLTAEQHELVPRLQLLLGKDKVSENAAQRGARIGHGIALALVQPTSLREAALALQECALAGVAVVPQGANTGLTGGSVPHEGCDRPTVVISLRKVAGSSAVDGGERVLCLAGTGIADLGKSLRTVGRESHSVLGSIFLNPTVAAGIAFGSGGTQLRKGPVYTERALYLRVRADGTVELVNELGLSGVPDGSSTLDAKGLRLLELVDASARTGDVRAADSLLKSQQPEAGLTTAPGCTRRAHASDYVARVTTLNGEVARFNADTSGPCYVRSEGKVLILASVHDTFPAPVRRRILWVSCDSLERASQLKQLLLSAPEPAEGGRRRPRGALLPASLEYMDAHTVEVVDRGGRFLIWAIKTLGIDGSGLASLWTWKSAIEGSPLPMAPILPDLALYHLNTLSPDPLPPRVRELSAQYGHHLLIDLSDWGSKEDTDAVARIRQSLHFYLLKFLHFLHFASPPRMQRHESGLFNWQRNIL